MLSSLGIYVDKNLIKYAKLSKYRNTYKVEVSNVEFFDNLRESLKRIIVETNSKNIPICINISSELYSYFNVFSILDKKDIAKSVEIEFKKFCHKNQIDNTYFESRYLLTDNKLSLDELKAINISTDKNELEKMINFLSDYKLYSMTPASISITNLLRPSIEESIAIINIENETKITVVIEGQIDRVDILDVGIGKIIEMINKTEMSWKKSYDILKNITIYNDDVKTLNSNDSAYNGEIVSILDKIIEESKKIFEHFNYKFNKVYITGLGSVINNVDIYFQKNLNKNSQVLKPFFIDSTSLKLPIKEYIEVNSAISLALDGLGFLNKEVNFAPTTKLNNIDNFVSNTEDFNIKDCKEILKKPFSLKEKMLARIIMVFVIGIIVYSFVGNKIANNINNKIISIQSNLSSSTQKLNNMEKNISIIKKYTNKYSDLINNVDTEIKENRTIPKDAIPNLLIKIVYLVPKKVQIVSIQNTFEKHIVIEAISEQYESIEYFINEIKNEQILSNVEYTNDEQTNSIFRVTIEGDLP